MESLAEERDERLRAIERRLDQYHRHVSGRPCAHCEDGWIHEERDVLECDDCGYFVYL
jgi:hypothetical protein